MNKITRIMLKIYKPVSGLDWLNYKITRKKDLTFHHILKKIDGGTYDITNGAILMPTPHHYLHIIESVDFETYQAINRMFKIINMQCYEPNNEQRDVIEHLLRTFEKRHGFDKTSKGKRLIKYEFTQRGYR